MAENVFQEQATPQQPSSEMKNDPLTEYVEELAAEEKGKEDDSVGFDTQGHNHRPSQASQQQIYEE